MAAAPAGAAVTARQGGGSSSYGNAGLGTADAGLAGARLLEAAEGGATRGVNYEIMAMVAQAGRGKKK